MLYNGQRITKKKTHVKKRTLNPVFNESFVFDLPSGTQSLDGVSLDFMLLDWDRVTKNEVSPKFLIFRKLASAIFIFYYNSMELFSSSVL